MKEKDGMKPLTALITGLTTLAISLNANASNSYRLQRDNTPIYEVKIKPVELTKTKVKKIKSGYQVDIKEKEPTGDIISWEVHKYNPKWEPTSSQWWIYSPNSTDRFYDLNGDGKVEVSFRTEYNQQGKKIKELTDEDGDGKWDKGSKWSYGPNLETQTLFNLKTRKDTSVVLYQKNKIGRSVKCTSYDIINGKVAIKGRVLYDHTKK